MSNILPIGATPKSVDFNFTGSVETAGTAQTISASKVGIITGFSLEQVQNNTGDYTRAVLLINGQEMHALEAYSTTPNIISGAGDTRRYTRKAVSFSADQQPILGPGDTINVKIKSSTTVLVGHARVEAYEYTP